jgi:hypothetical protein
MDYAVALSLQPHHYLTCFLPPPPCISKKGRGMGKGRQVSDEKKSADRELLDNIFSYM